MLYNVTQEVDFRICEEDYAKHQYEKIQIYHTWNFLGGGGGVKQGTKQGG